MGAIYHKGDADYKAGALFNGGGQTDYKGEEPYGAVRALEPATGELRWEYKLHCAFSSGLMTTGRRPGLRLQQHFVLCLDAQKGELLWRFETGGGIDANPVTYLAGGKQYVAIAAGHALLVFTLD